MNFVKWFVCIYWDSFYFYFIWFLFFILLMKNFVNVLICKHTYLFADMNHACIFRINPTWSQCVILLIYCWIHLLIFCWEVLHLCSSGYLSMALFSCSVLVWFCYQGNAGLVKWIWKSFHLFCFLKSLKRIGINSSLNVW